MKMINGKKIKNASEFAQGLALKIVSCQSCKQQANVEDLQVFFTKADIYAQARVIHRTLLANPDNPCINPSLVVVYNHCLLDNQLVENTQPTELVM